MLLYWTSSYFLPVIQNSVTLILWCVVLLCIFAIGKISKTSSHSSHCALKFWLCLSNAFIVLDAYLTLINVPMPGVPLRYVVLLNEDSSIYSRTRRKCLFHELD